MYCYMKWWKKPVEGFQVATYGPSADWDNYKISGSSYTIFDPEAIYVQSKMFRLTLQTTLNKVKVKEKALIELLTKYVTEAKRVKKLIYLRWEECGGPTSYHMILYSYHTLFDVGNQNCSDECWWISNSPPELTAILSDTTNDVITGTFNVIASNSSKWVAGSQGANPLAYSFNGFDWIGVGNSIFTNCRAVAWNGTRWLAGGEGSNTLAYSSDGQTWIGLGKSIFTAGCYAVASNGNRSIAGGAGTNTLAWSNDGISWTPVSSSPFSTNCNVIACSGSTWVAGGSGTNKIAYSTDNGITWNASASGNSLSGKLNSIVTNGTIWVAGGEGIQIVQSGRSNTIIYSNDGINWTASGGRPFEGGGSGIQADFSTYTIGVFTSACYTIAWNGSKWVASGTGMTFDGSGNGKYGTITLAESSDGRTWSATAKSWGGNSGISYTAMAWNGTLWLAGSTNGYLAYSYDGINFNRPSRGEASSLARVLTHYYKRLDDRGIINRTAARYHNDCRSCHSGHECPDEQLQSWYMIKKDNIDYTSQIQYYLDNINQKFDYEVVHEDFELYPVGKFLAKIQSRINKPSYDPLKLLPGEEVLNYPGPTGRSIQAQPDGVVLNDDNGTPFYANSLSLTDEKSQKNILLNPSEWRLVDLVPADRVLSGKSIADRVRNEFLAKKGISMSNQTGILTKTIAIMGTMNTINMDEIRRSVFYMQHFNFSDPNNTTKQLLYTQTSPYRLMISKAFSFEEEAFVANNFNMNQAVELTQDIINLLTYDARLHITNWGKQRRIGILKALTNRVTDMTQKNRITTDITNDMIQNTYEANPTINLLSNINSNNKSYIQTTESIQFTRASGSKPIIGVPRLTMTTTSLAYLDDKLYNIVGTPVEVFAIDDTNQKHSFIDATIVSFSPLDQYKGILTLDCTNVKEGSIEDPYYRSAFVDSSDNRIPWSYVYTIMFTTPTSKNAATRNITSDERSLILNAIAQCFYDLNSSNNLPNSGIRMTTLIDIYHVGNTIFDTRFRVSERDPVKTAQVLLTIKTLNENYDSYVNSNFSEKERVELDLNYTTQKNKLMSELEDAVYGYSSVDCGVFAQYIKIHARDFSHIKLSQIEVVDNTNQNIAINTKITWGLYENIKSKIYSYEEPIGNIIATDPNDPKTTEINDNYLELLRQQIRAKHMNFLIDGITTPRYEPDIYENDDKDDRSSNNFLVINLGSEINIAYVRLTYAAGENIDTTRPYTIILLDKSYIEIPTATGQTTREATIRVGNTMSVQLTTNTEVCPTPTKELFNPYWTARFYANIYSSSQYSALSSTEKNKCVAVNNSYIQITGYSGGEVGTSEADDVFTFNPKYNGGYIKNMRSIVGNINYQPTIKFFNTGDSPDINCQTDAKKIMHEYMMNIKHPDFLINNKSFYEESFYEEGYNYYVSSITGYAASTAPAELMNSKACKFSWKEIQKDAVTNKLIKTIDRTGIFVYIKNVYDWKVSNDYFVPIQARILPTETLPPFPTPIEMPIPTITEVFLKSPNDTCSNKTCSDLDVIDSVIQGHNTSKSDTILRVSKAVTPAPTQCEFECYTTSSPNVPKQIRMDIDVGFDSASWKCTYNYKDSQVVDATTGTYIQSNTPLLTQVYNYTTEMMQTFKQSVNDIYTNLSTIVQPHVSDSGDGIKSAVINYRQNTWGAFGEIKRLSTCELLCSDPQLIYSFLNYNRNFSTRISAIKGVGTFNSNTCDYMVDETTMSINNGFKEDNTRTAIYRATINGCLVNSTQNITADNTNAATLLVNRSAIDPPINTSGVIRSNHISFNDTLVFTIGTMPGWIQGKTSTFLGTPVFIESASSHLEGNVQSKTSNTITFYNFSNPKGDFNKYVSATGSTIIGATPSWLTNGIKVQIFSDPAGTLVYDDTITISGTTIALNSGTLATTTKYNIFLYENYTISNATPTEPSSAGGWTRPITLGTGAFVNGTTLRVEKGNTSYIAGQPFQLVNKFFNTPASFSQKVVTTSAAAPSWLVAGTNVIISTKTGGIQIYDGSIFSVSGTQITLSTFPSIEALLSNPSDSYNIFLKNDTSIITGTIASYSETNLVLTITSGGNLLAGTSYTIQQTARPKSYPTIPKAFSPIDWIDCSSDFAKKSTGQTSLIQAGINTCSNGTTPYTFTRPAGSDSLIYNTIPTNLSANTCSSSSSRINTLKTILGYPIAVEKPISGNTYEYRITALDTLPFNQTYKRVTFYGDCQISEIRGADISSSPNKNALPTDATSVIYANFFRHWWNIKYYYASDTQTKRVIGDINGYWYDPNTDSITFRCKSAEFGQNGPADIRLYNGKADTFTDYIYYRVVFRQQYDKTPDVVAINSQNAITSIDSISSNYMIYSVEVATAPPTMGAITSSAVNTTGYTTMATPDKLDHVVQEPSAALTTQFRFLRFRVSQSIAQDYAEITRLYFYKKSGVNYENSFMSYEHSTTFSTISNNIVTFVQAVPSWLKPNITIRISSSNTTIYSGIVQNVNGNQVTLDSSALSSNTPFNTSTTYIISFYNNGSGIFLQSARFRISDISSNYYNYRNTDCSGGYLKISNPYKTSYNICVVDTRKDPLIYSKYEYSKAGTCSIGYVDYNDSYQKTYTSDSKYTTNTNTCITTGTYGEVNSILVNANSSTKRLRLKPDQYLLIDLGDLLTIDAYTFVTGSASRLPTSFQLDGSYNGRTWKTLHTQTGFTYPPISTFHIPGYFPTAGGALQALTTQPFATNTALEGFENPVVESPLLEPFVDKTPYFKPDETALEPRYALPLVKQPTLPANTLYQPLNTQARRIKTMQFRVLETYDPEAKFVHMSMFQFHTSAGPVKSSMVRVSNPMGSRRSPKDSPESLFESTTKARWVDYNKMPLIFTFIEYPQAPIIGFQFAFPDQKSPMDGLPSRWKMEGSYDGRNWEVYHEKTEKAHYIGNASPIYKFKTEI